MGRVGSKKRMKAIRRQLRVFIESKTPKMDFTDYYKLCELDKLTYINKIYVLNHEHDFINNIIDEIRNGNGISREMPDIEGTLFGLEHTEVSPFYRHKKKGDSYRIYNRLMRGCLRTIEFESFDYHYLDMPSFFKKLGVLTRSKFEDNIVQAVEEKSEKYKKYEHFKYNGLWIDYPYYISFPNSNMLGYFLRDKIYSALLESPFDFFVFGCPKTAIFVSKETVVKVKPAIELTTHFFLNSQTELTTLSFKAKKNQRAAFNINALNDMLFVAEDVAMPHVWNLQILLPDAEKQPVNASLYFDDQCAFVTSLNEKQGIFNIAFNCEGIDGVFTTDFKTKLSFALSNVPFEAGESFSLHPSQHNASNKQKILTGISRLILNYGNKIDVYISPSVSLNQKGSMKIGMNESVPERA